MRWRRVCCWRCKIAVRKTGGYNVTYLVVSTPEGELKEARRELDFLGAFKADLRSFTRYYEFMSQLVDYDSTLSRMLANHRRYVSAVHSPSTTSDR